jgi:ATPase subunit of ABC transporter with duplicated ATPase domains
VNGAGKSTLLKIMAGLDKEFTGEAWAAEGVKVGYLPQEPQLDPSKDRARQRDGRRRPRPRRCSTASRKSR